MEPSRIADDDDYQPPVAVTVDHKVTVCPSCSKPLAKHGSMDLVRCLQTVEAEAEGAAQDVAGSGAATREGAGRVEPSTDTPGPATITPASFVDAIIARRDEPEPEPEPTPLDFIAGRKIPTVDAKRGMVVLSSRELDFEELAAALRTVIERERDEVVKRGGPLEKQNAELKERLAEALENAAMWRRRAQANAEARNSAQEQLDALVKANRKQRAADRKHKEANHTRVLDSKELLAIVQKTPGYTVQRTGGDHYRILKDGVFVTDMASSGQGNKVNMATRVALRKVGLDV